MPQVGYLGQTSFAKYPNCEICKLLIFSGYNERIVVLGTDKVK